MSGIHERIENLPGKVRDFLTDLRIVPRELLTIERVLTVGSKPLAIITSPIGFPIEKLAEQLTKRGIINIDQTSYSLICRGKCGAYASGYGISGGIFDRFPLNQMTSIFVGGINYKEEDKDRVSSCNFHPRGKWDVIALRDMVDGED